MSKKDKKKKEREVKYRKGLKIIVSLIGMVAFFIISVFIEGLIMKMPFIFLFLVSTGFLFDTVIGK